MIEGILIAGLAFAVAVILHEIGHYVAFYLAGVTPFISFEGINPIMESCNLSPLKQKIVLLNGIIWGAIPLIFYFGYVNPHFILILGVSGCYIIGCEHDLKELGRLKGK